MQVKQNKEESEKKGEQFEENSLDGHIFLN